MVAAGDVASMKCINETCLPFNNAFAICTAGCAGNNERKDLKIVFVFSLGGFPVVNWQLAELIYVFQPKFVILRT